jgi:hypothetical protein
MMDLQASQDLQQASLMFKRKDWAVVSIAVIFGLKKE